MENSNFLTLWLTVNRECNFRCKWCYAEGTHFSPEDNMSFEMATSLIDLASDLGVTTVIIIGGEPTYWKHLFETAQYIHEKKLISILVTNGYLLSKDWFFNKIEESNLNRINISLKAASREQYLEFTGQDAFHDVLAAMEKAGKLKNKYVDVSCVLSKLTVDSVREIPKLVKKHGVKSLYLDMCAPVFSENGQPTGGYSLHPNMYVKTMVENVDEIYDIMEGNFSIIQSTMGCIWPQKTLKRLIDEEKVIAGSCQMSRENGMVFKPNGELIPCNALYGYPLGKFGNEFNDAESFLEFRQNSSIADFFRNIKTYPKTECISCSNHTYCIGGCPLQWLIFDPAKIKKEGSSRITESNLANTSINE